MLRGGPPSQHKGRYGAWSRLGRRPLPWLIVAPDLYRPQSAAAVRGPKHVVKKGKTSALDGDEAKRLLDGIDVSTLVGLRDRALIALLVYTFARVSAALHMNVEDYYAQGKRWWVRLREKGGKHTKCRRTISSKAISTPT